MLILFMDGGSSAQRILPRPLFPGVPGTALYSERQLTHHAGIFSAMQQSESHPSLSLLAQHALSFHGVCPAEREEAKWK